MDTKRARLIDVFTKNSIADSPLACSANVEEMLAHIGHVWTAETHEGPDWRLQIRQTLRSGGFYVEAPATDYCTALSSVPYSAVLDFVDRWRRLPLYQEIGVVRVGQRADMLQDPEIIAAMEGSAGHQTFRQCCAVQSKDGNILLIQKSPGGGVILHGNAGPVVLKVRAKTVCEKTSTIGVGGWLARADALGAMSWPDSKNLSAIVSSAIEGVLLIERDRAGDLQPRMWATLVRTLFDRGLDIARSRRLGSIQFSIGRLPSNDQLVVIRWPNKSYRFTFPVTWSLDTLAPYIALRGLVSPPIPRVRGSASPPTIERA